MLERYVWRKEQTPPKEVLSPINSVAIYGLGQVGGGPFLQELVKVPEINIYGIGRDYQCSWMSGKFPAVFFTTEIEKVISQKPELLILATSNPVDEALGEIAEAILKAGVRPPIIVLPQNGVEVVPKTLKIFKGTSLIDNLVRASLFTPVEGDPKTGEFHYEKGKLKIALASVTFDSGEAVEQAAALFRRAGFKVQVCPDYRQMEDTKLFSNTVGLTGAVTGLGPEATFTDPQLFLWELQGIKDRLRILKEAGRRLMSFPELDIDTKKLIWVVKVPKIPFLLRREFARRIAKERSNLPPAAARRIAAGKRKTEVSYYLGPFLDLAEEYDLPDPVDKVILDIVKKHEDGMLNLHEMSEENRRDLLLRGLSKT